MLNLLQKACPEKGGITPPVCSLVFYTGDRAYNGPMSLFKDQEMAKQHGGGYQLVQTRLQKNNRMPSKGLFGMLIFILKHAHGDDDMVQIWTRFFPLFREEALVHSRQRFFFAVWRPGQNFPTKSRHTPASHDVVNVLEEKASKQWPVVYRP